MLAKKLAALSLTVIAYVAAQEQTFLSKSRDFEIYQPRLKQEFHGEAPVGNVGDTQYKCQYMAGLNFYNLQGLDDDALNFTSPAGKLSVQFCRVMSPENLQTLGCNPTAKTMAAF